MCSQMRPSTLKVQDWGEGSPTTRGHVFIPVAELNGCFMGINGVKVKWDRRRIVSTNQNSIHHFNNEQGYAHKSIFYLRQEVWLKG